MLSEVNWDYLLFEVNWVFTFRDEFRLFAFRGDQRLFALEMNRDCLLLQVYWDCLILQMTGAIRQLTWQNVIQQEFQKAGEYKLTLNVFNSVSSVFYTQSVEVYGKLIHFLMKIVWWKLFEGNFFHKICKTSKLLRISIEFKHS